MTQRGEQAGRRFPLLANELGLAAAILVVLALTTLVDSQHTYWYHPGPSAVDILRHTAMLGIFALGSAIVIISGGIDLSCGSMIAFSGTICASIMVLLAPKEMGSAEPLSTFVIAAAIGGSLVVGFLIGSLHAWLITVVGLPPFVATLATLVGLRSFGRSIVESVTAQMLNGRSSQIQIYDDRFRYLATSVWIPVVIFAVLAIAAWFLMNWTVTGRHLYAQGGNEQAALLSGIRTDRMKWLAYCLGAMTSSVAGIIYIADQSVADPQTLGRGYELNAIAAAVVGGCSLQGGIGTIPGTVLGVLFLRIVVDGVAKIIKSGADVYEGLVVGVLVVVAVAFSQLRGARGSRKAFFPGPLGWVAIVTLTLLASALGGLMAGRTAGALAAVVALVALGALKLLESRGRSLQ